MKYRSAVNIVLVSTSLFAAWLIMPARAAAIVPYHRREGRSVRVAIATHAVDSAHFASWLTAYGRAWSERKPDAMVMLFAPDATYREDPFGPATVGRAAMRADWTDIAEHQRDIHFNFEVLSETGQRGIAHWTASFVRRPSKDAVQLDGILMATFNSAGQCTEFREWWHRRSRKENGT